MIKARKEIAILSSIFIIILTALQFTTFLPFALMIKCFGAVIIGGISSNYSNPLTNKNKDLLINSGWKYGYKLPSPLLLNWPELIIIITFVISGIIDYYFIAINSKLDFIEYLPLNLGQYMNSASLAIIFLLFYNIDAFKCINLKEYPIKSIIVVLLTTFLVFPHYNIFISFIVVGIQYILIYKMTLDTLKLFPWNNINWNHDPKISLQKYSWATGLSKTVWAGLSPIHFNKPISVDRSIIFSLLYGWIGYVAGKLMAPLFLLSGKPNKAPEIIILIGLFLPLLFGSIYRLVIFTQHCNPPLSILGRISQKKIIIPDYDKVHIAPLCSIICLFFSIFLTKKIDPSIACGISAFSTLFCLLAIGPDYETWFYTSNCRIASLPSTFMNNTQQQNSNQRKVITIADAAKPQEEKLIDKVL